MAKPKITIFHCSFIYTGGGERIVFGQIDQLKKRGYWVECFAPVVDREKCYPDLIDRYTIGTLLPPLPRWFPCRHAVLMLLTCALMPLLAFRFRDTDLFVGENQGGIWLAFVASRVLGKPYLIYACQPNRMVYPRSLSRDQLWKNQKDFYFLSLFFVPFQPLLAWLDRVSFRGSDRPVLTNGYFIGREIGKIYEVDWQGCPSGAPFVKSKHKLLANNHVFEGVVRVGDLRIKKPYLLYVGRHEVWKRIDLAIGAMEKIVKQFPEVRLVIRGPFSAQTKGLKKLVRRRGLEEKVLFSPEKGAQKELRELYFNAAVAVFPSPKEDFGIVIIEAMGAGVPVVAWKRGGPTDIILNGQTGFLAKPFDLDDFAQKIIKLLQDQKLRRKMGRASWRRVKEHFSWERHGEILEGEIKRAISNWGGEKREATYLLDRQVKTLEKKHEAEGGYSEKLYRRRVEFRTFNCDVW